ncbi:hypothetical protein LGQ02_11400 [Bacillus shivajii]|uniref:hypothetical protein n=1 Tax=Bacillus shivajii TaxID=1983719 RepID=UPI001CF9E911|nr:hypothetical protein [Bacillus shivajii]UCZ51483.1 hypothetical protein LGQ02_11400 [Bacillus shivajii]
MKIKKRFIALIFLFLMIVFGYFIYLDHFTNEGIYENVINQNHYQLQKIDNSITFELFIKPDWIPTKSGEEKELNSLTVKHYDTEIYLDQAVNRGHDIYFNFRTANNMKFSGGKFVSKSFINDDGTFTANADPYSIQLYDHQSRPLDIGQRGFGPGENFSFGVPKGDQEKIKDGFYVRYSGYVLYEYFRK